MRAHAVVRQCRRMDDTKPRYEIHVKGVLGDALLSAFPALSGCASDGTTVLSGELADQAALHGVLTKVESLGLELLGVTRIA